MPIVIPPDPSLQHLRKQAKDLLKSFRRGDPEAQDSMRLHCPDAADRAPSLRDAQHVIAREHYFESWNRLKEYVDWDLPVRTQAIEVLKRMLAEKPTRVRQPIRQYRRNGTYWEKAPIHFATTTSR